MVHAPLMTVWEVVHQCYAKSEQLHTTLSVSTSPTIGCGGLLDEANLERFRIECASLPVVNLGSYKMWGTMFRDWAR